MISFRVSHYLVETAGLVAYIASSAWTNMEEGASSTLGAKSEPMVQITSRENHCNIRELQPVCSSVEKDHILPPSHSPKT